MSFLKKISGIVQIPIFVQLHCFSSRTALSQGSSEKFPIRSEKFSYSKKDVDKRCWFSVVFCANLVEFRIKIYVLKAMAVVNFAMYLLVFSSHSKNCSYLFLNSEMTLLLLICSKHRGASMFFQFTFKTEIILPETESIVRK